MNSDGLTPFPIKRFGGSADWDDPSQIPLGLAVVCKNCRFKVEGVGTRFGSAHTMQFPGVGDVTGLEVLQVLGTAAQQIPLIFSDTGVLLRETPPGSGTLVPVNPPFLLPASASMQTSKAYNSIYAAFSDLETPLTPPVVLNGVTGAANPVSQNPIGSLWTPGQFAQIGDLVRSSIDPTRWFRCTSPGIMSSTEPTWPIEYGHFETIATVVTWIPATAQDVGGGRSTWEEWTPTAANELPAPLTPATMIQNVGLGTIPAGKDVYFAFSYVVNEGAVTGESQIGGPIKFVNTAGNSQIQFVFGGTIPGGGPLMPTWMSTIIQEAGRFVPFKIRLYVAAVTAGTAEPAFNTYKWLGDFAVTDKLACSSIPSAAVPATSGPALITFVGSTFSFTGNSHVLSPRTGQVPPPPPPSGQPLSFIPPGFIGTPGARKMIVLRQDAQGALSSVDPGSVLSVNFTGFGQSNIVQITRATGGLTTATLADITGLRVGAPASVTGVLDDTFDDQVTILSVANAGLPSPQGFVTWQSAQTLAATSSGGTITGIAGNVPVAFLPPAGANDAIDIAAFTVQGANAGGPFFFINEAVPAQITTLQILSIQRTDGVVTLTLQDASSVSPGTALAIAGTPDNLELNGLVFVATVDGNTVTYAQAPQGSTSAITFGTATIVQELPTAAANPPGGSVGIPINFDDNFLSDAVDVTDQLTAIPAPPSIDAYFSPSLRKMVYTTGQDSSHYLSNTDDPANIQSPDGILSVEQNNGSKTVCFREMISGELLSLKENGGYAIQVDPTVPPSEWTPTRRWDGHGPCGPRAVALGPDFLIIFDENSGPYRYYQGSLAPIGKEKQGTWDRINKSAKKEIWVEVDDDLKEVRIGLPLDGATTPNKEMVLNYFNGWDDPVMVTLTGDLMPDRYGRRWSEDDRLSRIGRLLKRTLQTPIDQRIDKRQMLYGMENPSLTLDISAEEILLNASSNPQPVLPFGDYYIQIAKVVGGAEVARSRVLGPFQITQEMQGGQNFWQVVQIDLPGDAAEDSWNIYYTSGSPSNLNKVVSAPNNVTAFILQSPGVDSTGPVGTLAVDMTIPGIYNDSSAAIDSQYQPAFFSDPQLEIIQWEMMKGRAIGAGGLVLQAVTDDNSQGIKPLSVDLGAASDSPTKYSRGFGPITNELFSMIFSNGKVADAFFDLQSAVFYARPRYQARKG